MWSKQSVIKTALGQESADIIVYNGKIVNVNTLEIMNGYSIFIKNGCFAYVGNNVADGSIAITL